MILHTLSRQFPLPVRLSSEAMTSLLVVLPLFIPLLTALCCLAAGRARHAARQLGRVGSLCLLAAGLALLAHVWQHGILVVQVGSWPFPAGISLVADLLSATMVVLTGLMALSVTTYSLAAIDAARESFGYHALVHVLLMGTCGAFLTGDLFNLFVWFELTLIGSFVLLSLGGEPEQLKGAFKYVVIHLVSSAMFLTAIGILYGITGTLNMADLAQRWPVAAPPSLTTTVAVIFLVAFGIKAAAFPLFFWLPASYHTPPVAVAALFAGLLTKLGVYALLRASTLLLTTPSGPFQTLFLWMSGLTMVTGVLGAYAQNDFRRILAFHSVSQVGYMLMGLGLFTPASLGGSLFFMLHHSVVKTALFLLTGVTHRLRNSHDIRHLGGLYDTEPIVASLFLVPALSLAGVPPLSGFFAKLMLFEAGIQRHQYAIVAVAAGVSLLTLLSMTKIWTWAFWTPSLASSMSVSSRPSLPGRHLLWSPIAMLAALALALGVFAQPLVVLSLRAGEQLLHRNDYIRALSGGSLCRGSW